MSLSGIFVSFAIDVDSSLYLFRLSKFSSLCRLCFKLCLQIVHFGHVVIAIVGSIVIAAISTILVHKIVKETPIKIA